MESISWQVIILALIAASFAAIPPTVAAWRTGNITMKNAEKADAATKEVKETLASNTTETTAKLDTIHVLVNSRLTEALKKIDRLESKLYDATGEKPTGEPPQIAP